jgi:hypothetical protein
MEVGESDMAVFDVVPAPLNRERTRSVLILCAKAIVIAALGLLLGGGFARFATATVHWLAPMSPPTTHSPDR